MSQVTQGSQKDENIRRRPEGPSEDTFGSQRRFVLELERKGRVEM